MRRVIMESPFEATENASIADHVQYARRCLRDSLQRGEAPLASHLLYTQVLDDDTPSEREMGIAAGHEWMDSSTTVVFYVDMGFSKGMRDAFQLARDLCADVEVRSLQDER